MVAHPALRGCSRTLRASLRANGVSRAFGTSSTRCSQPGPSSSSSSRADRTTHFGFETVAEEEKQGRVAGVFTNVAESYDKMNDFMSLGIHRLWKYVVTTVTMSIS